MSDNRYEAPEREHDLPAEEAARSKVRIDDRLRLMGRKGNVSEEEGRRLATRLGIPLEEVRRRAAELGIEWVGGKTSDRQGNEKGPMTEKPPLGKDEPRQQRIKVCQCGFSNDVSDGRTCCASCGLELTIRCPSCGRVSDVGAKVCGCGFRFGDMDRASELFSQADRAIESLDFEMAAARLSDGDRLWPNSDRSASLMKKLQEHEAQAAVTLFCLHEAVEEKRFAEALEMYEDLQSRFPSYSAPELEQRIRRALDEAGTLLEQAKRAAAETQAVELCVQAGAICTDLPGLGEFMRQYPPERVTGFRVKPDPVSRANVLSWQADDRTVSYVVCRSSSGRIRNEMDGTEVFRGGEPSFCDRDIEPGTVYRYDVFAERFDVCSEGAEEGNREIVNLFEVRDLTAVAGDGSAELSWKDLPSNASARVYRIDGSGERILAASVNGNSCTVGGLENDIEQELRVTFAYQVNGSLEETPGVSVKVRPVCPPACVCGLRIIPGQDDQYEVVWQAQGTSEVRVYCAHTRPAWQCGEVIPLAAIQRSMHSVQHKPLTQSTREGLAQGEQGVSFRYEDKGELYLTAVAVKGEMAVFGPVERIMRRIKPRILRIEPVNGKIRITADPLPEGAAFLVLNRPDRFSEGWNDPQAVRHRVERKTFLSDGAILLDGVQEKKYYFSIYLEWLGDQGKEYSEGHHWLFDYSPKLNITYSIKVSRRLFREPLITLEFESDRRSFLLPDIDMMSAVGNVPVFKDSCTLFHAIPAQQVEGVLTVQLPMPAGLAKDTCIKAFFRNPEDQDTNQLRLKLRSSHKIN